MNVPTKLWTLAALALASGLLARSSFAQTQDYPTHQGNNQRTGNNGNPTADNPGKASLSWFFPNGPAGFRPPLVQDNSSLPVPAGWTTPIVGNEAPGAYLPFTTPAYIYTKAVPSDFSGDPTVPLGGATLQTYSWSFNPGAVPGDYRLYVWTPVGPTTDASGAFLYPQKYFVYKVNYGTGQTQTIVMDQTLGRGGFAPLGGTELFHYDGVTPITITVYNTIPRDSNGNLLGVAVDKGGNVRGTYYTYADAAQIAPDFGYIVGDPIIATNIAGSVPVTVYSAANRPETTIFEGKSDTQYRGILSSLKYDDGTVQWSFSPLAANSSGVVDDDGSAGMTASPLWKVGNSGGGVPGFSTFLGPTYLYDLTTNSAATEDAAVYTPALGSGTYDIYLWLPGLPGTFAQSIEVDVTENGVVIPYTVDLTQASGYYRLGGRKFASANATSATNRLSVTITNYSPNAADVGKYAYADAIRFVSASNLAIVSTPVHATVKINGAATNPADVVVVAAEDGHLYCLDANGRGDGTTDIYWVYPSIKDPLNPAATDPNNHLNGPDGTNDLTIAEMPTGFDTKGALVEEIPPGSGQFNLYVGANNGRVYCLDMAGRGDFNVRTRLTGTTTRLWSFPDDYPSPAKQSLLGPIEGGLDYARTAGGPAIIVPTAQGRVYALDAVGNPASRTTTINWAYPTLTSPTLGPVVGTPAIDGNPSAVYFGTARKGGTAPGQFISLDVNTGLLNWSYNGTAAGAVPCDSFLGGCATAFNNQVGDGRNYIYASNLNGFVYAFDQAGNVTWSTNELNSIATAAPMLTQINAYDNTGAYGGPSPIVMVPSGDGNFYGLYAALASANRVGGRLAYGYTADGNQILAGMTSGHQFMYGGDNHGLLYAFSNTAGSFGGTAPGGNVGVPNDPTSIAFGNAQFRFLLPASYQSLRQTATPGYAAFTAPANFSGQSAFDFGETMYLLVYDFPFNNGTATISANFTFTLNGVTYRTIPAQAQQFTGAPGGKDGYAVLAFTLQADGNNSLAPGTGLVSYTLAATSTTGVTTNYVPDTLAARRAFTIANPIGIALQTSGGLYGLPGDSLGASLAAFADPTNLENSFNGSALNGPGNLLSSVGLVGHGQSSSTTIGVYDRSLMALINGPAVGGLSQVRVDRPALGWVGGYNSVVKPFGGTNGLYGGGVPALESFEDYPINFPNGSLDYPDLSPETVRVTKDPNGNTENPAFSGVTLGLPGNLFVLDANGDPTTQPVSPGNYAGRTPNPSPFEFAVDVPRYQPANLATLPDALGTTVSTGYLGEVNVFVDSNTNGRLDLDSGHREAYRTFGLGTGVGVDEKLTVLTPNVDLGALAEGTGIAPGNTVGSANVFNPFGIASEQSLYAPFKVLNEGNTNLLNVRVAHQVNDVNGYRPWPFYAGGLDDLAFLDGNSYLWSDLDPVFSRTATANGGPLARGEIIAPKSRVSERSGTQILTNPRYKTNVNLGHTGGPGDTLIPGAPSNDPRVGITPPIGFPVGAYSQLVRVIEDRDYRNPSTTAPNYDLSLFLGTETYADPAFTLSFNVAETRLTNSSSLNGAVNGNVARTFAFPMADSLIPTGSQPFTNTDANIQPTGMRDLFGGLTAAWSSNRSAITVGDNGTATNYAYRLYIAGLPGVAPLQANQSNSPLRDLKQFGNGGSTWFATAGPFPFGASSTSAGAANTLFSAGAGQHVIGTVAGEEDTVRFGNPSFPAFGAVYPFNTNNAFGTVLMAFEGAADLATAQGRVGESRVFVVPVTPIQGGAPKIGAPIAISGDDSVKKGKPSVVQLSNTQAAVFYADSGSTNSRLYYSLYSNGGSSAAVVLPTGNAFESVSDPSVSPRTYVGADANTVTKSGYLYDISFAAMLRGRPNSEIFLGRIPTDANGAPNAGNSQGEIFSYFSPRFLEQASTQSEPGTFRTQGVQWNPLAPFDLQVAIGNSLPATILTGSIFNPETGVITAQTSLGTAYVDTNIGTIRFATSIPGRNIRLFASYQPRFLRLSESTTAGVSGPSLLWDNRRVSSSNYDPASQAMFDRYWYTGAAGLHASLKSATLRTARYMAFYNRAAAGPGQSARPLVQTVRLGVQLPGPIATLSNGDVDFGQLTVNSVGEYQVDPVNGRIYFTQQDEDAVLTIVYRGVKLQLKVGLITERRESLVTMNAAINETGLSAFIDPFDPAGAANGRPDLVWLFWNSTRGGTSDVYFETIAPALYPIVGGK